MRRPHLALLVAGGLLLGPAHAEAMWSAPLDLSPVSEQLAPADLAVGGDGTAAVGWAALQSPAPRGVAMGHVAVLAPDGRAREVDLPGRGVVAGPVLRPDGGLLILTSQDERGDGAYLTLRLERVDSAGRARTLKVLSTSASLPGVALVAGPGGAVVAAWAREQRSAAAQSPSGRTPYTLQALSVGARGDVGRIRTLERTSAYDTDHGGQVAAAVGADGRAVVAFATARGRARQVDAFTRSPGRNFGVRRVIGRQEGFAAMAAMITANGRAVIAWGSQDGGEEANEPWRVRVAVSGPQLDDWRKVVLDRGAGVARPVGQVRVAPTSDGRVAVAWSAVARSIGTRPVRVAVSSPDGSFGAAQTVAADGRLGGLAGGADGVVLVGWATISRGVAGAAPATQALVAVRPPGARSFGPAEPVAAPDVAEPPQLAVLADGRAVAAWVARPGGVDPSLGLGVTARLRVATRTP